jgi:sortase A
MERFFLLAGILAVALALVEMLLPVAWQIWANREFDRRMSERRGAPEVRRQPEIGAEIPKDGLIGRLIIPRLSLSAIVREGINSATLSLAAGHIPGTALPGARGNTAVAGHRDTLFRGLKDVQPGDIIEFETFNGSLKYRVRSTEVVKPTDIGVLQSGRENELTLVTCFPFYYIGSAPDRFIVKASQFSASPMTPEVWAQVSKQNAEAAPRGNEEAAPARASAPKAVSFTIPVHHSRVLAPGISLGITDTGDGRVNGWMWLMPDRRTVWLRDQNVHDPLVFYNAGKRHEVTITAVAREAASGYLSQ